MLKCDPRAFAQCPGHQYCGSCAAEVGFMEGSECDKFNQSILSKPITIADRIRTTDDVVLMNRIYELHVLLSEFGHYELAEQFCDCKAECASGEDCNEVRLKACIMRWLQRSVEES